MPRQIKTLFSSQDAGSLMPQLPRRETVDSPYFSMPVASPYFDKNAKPERLSQCHTVSEGRDASIKRGAKANSPKRKRSTVLKSPSGSGPRLVKANSSKRKRSNGLTSPSVSGLRLVLRNTHSDRSVPMAWRLLAVKPRLLQGHLHHTPWWLLIAVVLLNKTTGKQATPVLYKIMAKWPTMEALSQACVPELKAILTPLGLASVRTQRLILFANMYLNDPPSPSDLRASRVVVSKGEPKYKPTMISHLPGMGRYALDSFRLFCGKLAGEGDWKNVMPLDKELRVYARWRWAVIGFIWDAERGVIGPVNERYLNDLCEGNLNPRCTVPDPS